MTDTTEKRVRELCQQVGRGSERVLEAAEAVQREFGCVDAHATDIIAQEMDVKRVEVEGVVSFYAFLSDRPQGNVVIRLCNDVIDRMKGADEVADALTDELGIDFGQTTPDGKITIEKVPCIGMSDQAPAALINNTVVTYLGGDQARSIVRRLLKDPDPTKLVGRLGDGNNAHDLVRSMVHNNIRMTGDVVLAGMPPGAGLRNAIAMSPVEVINDIKTSRLRGRGGAGFPAGMKWEFTRAADGDKKYVLCNADEGEPGTFKDRVILTEQPKLFLEGMAIAGYAIGAQYGILYLRAEYAYLYKFLQHTIQDMRDQNLLGQSILGREGLNFDVEIRMGAGAYVCGEETAMIRSCEGRRGDPKTRPPFPAQKGYLDCPTTVNNVETFCNAARILEMGPGWFAKMGSPGSKGTKLLSISGDCSKPGIYEVHFGIRLSEVLALCGADDAAAVQMGGPSGHLVGPVDFDRPICYDHLATGGSLMVFDSTRDLWEIVDQFLDFFADESCGYCTPCRVGNVLMKERVERLIAGQGVPQDLEYLENLATTVKSGSRCGLGQTSPNPVLSVLKSFPEACREKVRQDESIFQPAFNIRKALGDAERLAGRETAYPWK